MSKTSTASMWRVSAWPDTTLPGLVAELVASRRAGGYRFKVQERVLRQFADHCRRAGYPDGAITKEAVDGFLYGGHPRAPPGPPNQLAPPPPGQRPPAAPASGPPPPPAPPT